MLFIATKPALVASKCTHDSPFVVSLSNHFDETTYSSGTRHISHGDLCSMKSGFGVKGEPSDRDIDLRDKRPQNGRFGLEFIEAKRIHMKLDRRIDID